MGKVVETKPKKKKGRPSLIDIQKRNIKEEQDRNNNNPHNPYSNHNLKNSIIPNPIPNPNRRFTRRNPIPDGISPELDRIDGGDDEEDNDDLNANRKEKKLKLFLRLPSHQQQQQQQILSVNSTSLNSGSYESDSNAENGIDETQLKKRKINVVRDGSGHGDDEKGENPNSASRARGTLPDCLLESSPATPLPDKKLLVFILDRLQKKDTYGVFSEPVDPKELPDYHDVIKHPMDFGTVRKKLEGGAYANLEQFEKDVFLICSNAMQYNAPDTIYFRQARSIQELAKKDFENSRHESEDNEPQPKVVRRGRPPTKHLKKPLGRPPFDRAGSEFSVDATLVTGGDNAIWYNSYDLRKGPLSDKSVLTDASGRTFRGSHNSEVYSSWLAKHKSEWNDEFPGSMLKGMPMKNGQKQFVLDENRRNTYKQCHPSVSGHEPSVFTTVSGEKQQLMAVGIHSDYGYARSLARFASYLGPVAWKFASMKIKRALPAGVKFGPGWVGENEVPPPQPPPPLLSSPSPQVSSQQPLSLPNISPITATPLLVEPRGDESLEKLGPLNNSSGSDLPSRHLPPSTSDPSTSTVVANRPPEPTTTKGLEAIKDSNNKSKYSLLNSAAASIRHRPPFQIHQKAVTHPTVNGFSGGFGFNHSSQMGKFVRPASQVGSLGSEASMPNRMLDMPSKSNHNFVQQMPANSLDSEDPMLANSSTINSGRSLPDTSHETQATPKVGLRPNPSWRGYSLHQNPDSVLPPDLNVRFQSPGSPSSSVWVDSPQPDLALQL